MPTWAYSPLCNLPSTRQHIWTTSSGRFFTLLRGDVRENGMRSQLWFGERKDCQRMAAQCSDVSMYHSSSVAGVANDRAFTPHRANTPGVPIASQGDNCTRAYAK
ncbi:hypothetical protein M409DRAFT_54623 [Zasmidium cellare ATCC 36951]|uniref:Uncharacterized protein n=1 Tax=Zasmidium cellare ATCC 36951 TaxID=1080233 RepID=A0A6A6CHZ7_ZASCE|nr:uncharacterized protein M409DRAFT_54623 [Zasmidium cellare ATCC 36951]KAF2166844.1 hypothetical protein M409DRAFT_54623 [Zasmidium cellare ATCC 36951]